MNFYVTSAEVLIPLSLRRATTCRKRSWEASSELPGFSIIRTPSAQMIIKTKSIVLHGKLLIYFSDDYQAIQFQMKKTI